jgi:hypothetical protein
VCVCGSVCALRAARVHVCVRCVQHVCVRCVQHVCMWHQRRQHRLQRARCADALTRRQRTSQPPHCGTHSLL